MVIVNKVFDPNLRPPLWESLDHAKMQIKYGLSKCDILKISDDELEFVTGYNNIEMGIKTIQEQYQIPLILLTRGKPGSIAFCEGIVVSKTALVSDNTVYTTGAGDTFMECVLNFIIENGMKNLTESQLGEMLKIANAAASIITTKKGALRVMPEKEEIFRLFSKRKQ